MILRTLLQSLSGLPVHMVGIKGTGMSALAEILVRRGAVVTGSDTEEVFYTDAILRSISIPVFSGFSAGHLPKDVALVIHSAAYDRAANPELVEAIRRGIPVVSYPEALGGLSSLYHSVGISGVHGKTTTTAIAGTLASALRLKATILAGSAVSNFGGRSTLLLGDEYFIAETCEYRRHFLDFSPSAIVITSIEPDHQDYYPGYQDILKAFIEYGMKLPNGGTLIYCADDPGASEAAGAISEKRNDIKLVPYGESADGNYRITGYRHEPGRNIFTLRDSDREWELRIPGKHIVLDAVAALSVVAMLCGEERGKVSEEDWRCLQEGLATFRGSKRRSEIIGEVDGILFMDDYAHHPTAIHRTLEGLRDFYPERRIVVDFMSHTYSRTEALIDQFAHAFGSADIVILHKIYPSAREKGGTVSGRDLYERMRAVRDHVQYFEEVMDSLDFLTETLKAGDLFITLGAGDNWRLGPVLYERISGRERSRI